MFLLPSVALCDAQMGVCTDYVDGICNEFVTVSNISALNNIALDWDAVRVVMGKCLAAWAVGVCVGAIANMVKKGR